MKKRNFTLFAEAMCNLEQTVENVCTYQDMENFVVALIKQGNLSVAINILEVLDNTMAAWYFFEFNSATVKIITLYPITCQEDVEKVIRGITGEKEWIPTKFGVFPKDLEMVQVTYLGCFDSAPHCDEFAYRDEGKWYWVNGHDKVEVKITAWKYMNEPYKGE